jgi:hypothetical protein
LIPPCAATVCDRVGKSFEIQAVLKPASARPKAARRPAPPAPTTIASYSWSMTGYFEEMNPEASFARRLSVPNMRAAGRVEEKFRDGVRRLFVSYCALLANVLAAPCGLRHGSQATPQTVIAPFRTIPALCQSFTQCGTRLCAKDAAGRKARMGWRSGWSARITHLAGELCSTHSE